MFSDTNRKQLAQVLAVGGAGAAVLFGVASQVGGTLQVALVITGALLMILTFVLVFHAY